MFKFNSQGIPDSRQCPIDHTGSPQPSSAGNAATDHDGNTDERSRTQERGIKAYTPCGEALPWFPLAKEVLRVEKLCTIVGFSTEQTRTLIAGREVTHDGTLYSEEHGRSFTARNVTAKIRQESVSKRFVLYINQTPVGEWFKEQFERLKQSMRQPIQSQRKSKGMKL